MGKPTSLAPSSAAEWAAVAAAVLLGLVSLVLAALAFRLAEQQRDVAYFDNAATCIAYRDQVFSLVVDYGQSAEQIDHLLHLETDFAGVEDECGDITLLVAVARDRPAK